MRLGFILLAMATQAFAYLYFQVEPKAQECFYHQLQSKENFKMDFEVLRGGLLDIKLRVTDPTKKVLTEKLAFFNIQDDEALEKEGRVEFKATRAGKYEICFDNRMSRWTSKVVGFDMGGNSQAKKESQDEIAKLEHLGPMVDSVIKIADELDVIERIQRHMRVDDQMHRDMTATTNGRVQYMAVLESVLLIAISFAQYKFIQSWFSVSNLPSRGV